MRVTRHPRPLLERARWHSLDGQWRFAFDDEARWEHPEEVRFDREIVVPFPFESAKSGIHDPRPHRVVWYTNTLRLEESGLLPIGGRLLLHFGAVDYRATVWANGQLVASHEGGHTPFSADVTRAAADGVLEIVVRAEDDPHDLAQPRGKQDWQVEPHVIWYPRTTGIWQTVWLEDVPQTRITRLDWSSNLERWEIALEARLEGTVRANVGLRVRLSNRGKLLRDDTLSLSGQAVTHRIALPNAGIDDVRNHLLWSPEHPNLIQAQLELFEDTDAGRVVLDRVSSYTAMRSIGTDGQRFTLNGHGYSQRLALDQGYWPDTLMAGTDEQLRLDVELAKRLGFNGVRKHQKLESPRWLYWCDVLGLLVWAEMPSHYAFTPQAVGRLTREWTEAVERDRSHPCIVAWVPFNESWGVPDLPTNATHRHYVRALYHLTKTLDPTRPAITNDGWEFAGGDWIGVHDYTHKPEKLMMRYGDAAATASTLARPHGRTLVLEDVAAHRLPVVLSEFGGIAFAPNAAPNWGYSRAHDSEGFLERFEGLMAAVHELRDIAGFCYTQLYDTFQEKNGLLTEHREPKADLERVNRAVRGERNAHEAEMEGEPNPMGYSRRWYDGAPQRPEVNTAFKPASNSND